MRPSRAPSRLRLPAQQGTLRCCSCSKNTGSVELLLSLAPWQGRPALDCGPNSEIQLFDAGGLRCQSPVSRSQLRWSTSTNITKSVALSSIRRSPPIRLGNETMLAVWKKALPAFRDDLTLEACHPATLTCTSATALYSCCQIVGPDAWPS